MLIDCYKKTDGFSTKKLWNYVEKVENYEPEEAGICCWWWRPFRSSLSPYAYVDATDYGNLLKPGLFSNFAKKLT